VTPQIYKAWKMVISLVGGTLNTVTITVPRTLESTGVRTSDENSQLSVAEVPREW